MDKKNWHQSQRGFFAGALYQAMKKDKDIILIVGDLGFGVWDAVRDEMPDQFLNVGAAETAMMGIACGLALEGKKPFVYSISSFLINRPYETIRLYVSHENIPVRMIGSGRDLDYHIDGFSHDCSDLKPLLNTMPNIIPYWPDTKEEIPELVKKMVEEDRPSFISLRR